VANDYLKIRRVANQGIARNAVSYISWDTEDSDAGGYFAPGAPTKVLTVPASKAGKFVLSSLASLDGGAPEERALIQYSVYNSSDVLLREIRRPHGHQDNLGSITAEMTLNVGDYVMYMVYQSWNNGTRNFVGTLEMFRISS